MNEQSKRSDVLFVFGCSDFFSSPPLISLLPSQVLLRKHTLHDEKHQMKFKIMARRSPAAFKIAFEIIMLEFYFTSG